MSSSTTPPYILVVEDDPALLDLLKLVLEEVVEGTPYTVTGVESASHAAALMSNAPPAAILLDLRLPDLHGLTLLRSLRASPELARVPVVVHTATPEPEVASLDVATVLRKPARATEIRRAVRAALGLPQVDEDEY